MKFIAGVICGVNIGTVITIILMRPDGNRFYAGLLVGLWIGALIMALVTMPPKNNGGDGA